MRCDVCLREIKDPYRAMVFWEVGPNRRIVNLLVAHKGGRHQGSTGCDPNFRYSWELYAALEDPQGFVEKLSCDFAVRGWVATKLMASFGMDVTDRVGEAK